MIEVKHCEDCGARYLAKENICPNCKGKKPVVKTETKKVEGKGK